MESRIGGQEVDSGQESKMGERNKGEPQRIKRKGLPVFLHRTYICTACTLVAPTHPLHYTVTLDSGIEARYVRRKGRGLGIWPLYHSLA